MRRSLETNQPIFTPPVHQNYPLNPSLHLLHRCPRRLFHRICAAAAGEVARRLTSRSHPHKRGLRRRRKPSKHAHSPPARTTHDGLSEKAACATFNVKTTASAHAPKPQRHLHHHQSQPLSKLSLRFLRHVEALSSPLPRRLHRRFHHLPPPICAPAAGEVTRRLASRSHTTTQTSNARALSPGAPHSPRRRNAHAPKL